MRSSLQPLLPGSTETTPVTSPPRTQPSFPSNWSSNRLTRLASALALILACQPLSVVAQDQDASRELEDLIPDSAVENPESWATQVEQPAQGETVENIETPASLEPDMQDFDLPLAEFPPPPLAWPEEDELPPVEQLEPDGQVEFAEVDEALADPFADTEVERVSRRLEIAFPRDRSLFPVRDEFLATFKSLSTIEQLNGDGDSIALVAARADADEELLGTLLQAYGYYDSLVARSVAGAETEDGGETGDMVLVRFAVVPGPRYAFGAIDLGDLALAPDYDALRAAFGIASGDPVSSYKILEEQLDLDTALGESGYPFAEIDAPELLIDHARDEGDLTLVVRPKGKYVFGAVNSSLPQFLSGKHLATIARFDPGDIYQRSDTMDLRRAIIATGLVASADVKTREVTPPNGDIPGVVDLDVALTKAKLRTLAGAIGYGSEEGIRVEGSWEHRNLFPPEGALKVRTVLGTREQLAGVTFTRNNLGRRDQVLTLDTYASNTTSDSVEARTLELHGTFERLSNLLFQKPFSWAVGAEVLYSDERNRVLGGIPRPRQEYFIGSIFGRATIDSTDSLLDPTKGFRLTGFLAPEASYSRGHETAYLRNQFDASFYKEVGGRVVLAGRGRFATIQGAEIYEIAPSRRLYSGGSNSVRGYGYQAVGPRNDFGEPTGGRSLVEASFEARINTGFFGGALQVVPFIDAGTVSIQTTPDFRFVSYGAGIGIRYKMGFGPIRVDAAVPLNRNPMFDSPFALYVSLGQAF